MLQDCVECMGVGANMGRSDNIAEEGTRAVSTIAQGAAVAKEMGDVRCTSDAPLQCGFIPTLTASESPHDVPLLMVPLSRTAESFQGFVSSLKGMTLRSSITCAS